MFKKVPKIVSVLAVVLGVLLAAMNLHPVSTVAAVVLALFGLHILITYGK